MLFSLFMGIDKLILQGSKFTAIKPYILGTVLIIRELTQCVFYNEYIKTASASPFTTRFLELFPLLSSNEAAEVP